MPGDLTPPKKGTADATHETARAIFDLATAGVGGRLFDYLVSKPIERRRDEWREEIGKRILKLEAERRVDVDALRNDETFVTLLTQASAAAVRSHQKEKLAALNNAILNAALGDTPDEIRQQVFLNWIIDLTPLHMQVLAACERANYQPGRLSQFLSEFRQVRELGIADVIENDLVTRGLIKPNRTAGVVYLKPNEKWITPLGQQFLSFIRDPLEQQRAT